MATSNREVPLQRLPVQEARRRALERAVEASGGGDQSVDVTSRSISSTSGGRIPLRLYRPPSAREASLGLTVFLHGGGWVYGNLESHDGMCRDLAAGSGSMVLAVDYRLAPEYPFPCGLDDARDVLEWAMSDGSSLGADGTRVAIAGDSSGGNLAAATCLARRDAGLALPRFQLLLYPSLDLTLSQPSMLAAGGRRFGGSSEIAWTVEQYLAGRTAPDDPLASPLLAADHAGLSPTHVVTTGFDPLVDEGRAYVAALAAAGVPVTHQHYEEQIHGFLSFAGVLPDARDALFDAARVLGQGLDDN